MSSPISPVAPSLPLRGEVDERIVGTAESDDRAAVLDRVDDRGLAEIVGEHERRRAADRRRRSAPSFMPARVIVAAADAGDPVTLVLERVPQRDHARHERRDADVVVAVISSMPETLSHGVSSTCFHAQPMHACRGRASGG